MGGSSRFSGAEQYWNGHAPALIKKFMDMDAESERIALRIKNRNDSNSLMVSVHRFRDSWQHAMGKPSLIDDFYLCKAAQSETGKVLNEMANRTILQLVEDHDEKRAAYLDGLKRKSEISEMERFYEDGLKWIVDIHRQTVSVQADLNNVVPLGEVSTARIDKGHMLKAFQSMGQDGKAYRSLVLDIRELADYIYDGLEEQGISSHATDVLKEDLVLLCNILPPSKGLNDLSVKKSRLVSFEDALFQPANKLLALYKDAKNEMKKIRGSLYITACDILEDVQVPEGSSFLSEIRYFIQPELMNDMDNRPSRKNGLQIKA